jgi:DNA-binding protein, ybaB/ebfC family
MKQAQKMQQDMQRMQQELQTREFTATVGGGAVRATAYGSKVIKSIEIDPACVDPDDVEMLQDLVLSAVNEAMRMAEEATNSEVSKLTGGMGLGF